MTGRYPPHPLAVRLLIWPLRIVATLASLLALAVMLFVSTWGEPGISSGTLVALFGFTLLTWIHPLSPWFLGVLGAMAVGWMFSDNPAGGLAGLGLVGVLWWLRRRGGTAFGQNRIASRLEAVEPDAAMALARRHIRSFEALGFQRVGAYRARIGPIRVTVSLLIDESHQSYASVTDAVMHVTSAFPGDRALVTRNNQVRALPPHLLVNSEGGGSPEELVQSHRRALLLVAERDHHPITISPPQLVDFAIESERRVLGWKPPRSADSRAWSGPLWQRAGRYQQIDDWHNAAARPDQAS